MCGERGDVSQSVQSLSSAKLALQGVIAKTKVAVCCVWCVL